MSAIKYVTFTSEHGARVGVMEGDRVYDACFDGDMVTFIEAGAPASAAETAQPQRLYYLRGSSQTRHYDIVSRQVTD